MAISAQPKSLKVVLKLAEGQQIISGCNLNATDEQLYQLGGAVAGLTLQNCDAITKVEETTLIEI